MNTQNKPRVKGIIRSTYIVSVTFVFSLLIYMALVNFISSPFVLVIGLIFLGLTCFALYYPDKVGVFSKKAFLIPILIITTGGVIDSLTNNRQPMDFNNIRFSKPYHNEKIKEQEWIEITKDSIRGSLKDSQSAKFRNIHFVSFNGTPMVCGEVNSKNSFGAMTGYQRFVATGKDISLLEEQTSEFLKIWNEICQ